MKTPQQTYPELAQALGVPELYLKREDLHNYGSHKGRSIPLMIKKYTKEGVRDFVISSSGNAALAAITAVQAHNRNNGSILKLKVYVGQNINPAKLKLLTTVINDANVTMEQIENPKQEAFLEEKNGTAKFLRQSTDDLALEGYAELAEELLKIQNLEAVFIPTSSGTTAQGIGDVFLKKENPPQVHIVQTSFCHPIAHSLITSYELPVTTTSLADAIVDKIAFRKDKVVEIIKQTNGSGWIANDEEIKNAMELVEKHCNLKISPNSALSVVGLIKAVQNNLKFTGPVVCLITGR